MAELVKALDIGYGTLLYNHKSGRSEALSVPVVEKILDRFPDATFEELTGRGPRKIAAPDDLRYRPGQSIMLCGEAASGIWTLHPRWHRFRWQPLHLPPGVAHPGPGSFAIIVGQGAEAALPIGSYVVCKEYQSGTPLSDGLRVVIHRYREKRTEVRLFEVLNDKKEVWLRSLSTSALHQEAFKVPQSKDGAFVTEGIEFDIVGIMLWAWIPQPEGTQS
jgi:hypothetical protein